MDVGLDLSQCNRAGGAIDGQIAKPLGIGVVEAAQDIFEVSIAGTRDAIRLVTVARGHDLSDFALLSYGGAGSIFASQIATDLGIPVTIVPLNPGVFSAFGLLSSDRTEDLSVTRISRVDETSVEEVAKIFQHLEQQALKKFTDKMGNLLLKRFIDMRYIGQAYEVMIPVPEQIRWDEENIAQLIEEFHRFHEL